MKKTHDDEMMSRPERLKIEYAHVMDAMYKAMTGFAPGGTWGGISELADLIGESSGVLRNTYGPTVYDHAPTLHGFLHVLETLKPHAVANEVARVADCVAIPVSPRVPAPEDDAEALRMFIEEVVPKLLGLTLERTRAGRLSAGERQEAKVALCKVIAWASHLLPRFDPAIFAPPPPMDAEALARFLDVEVPVGGPSGSEQHKGTESLDLGVGSGSGSY